MVFGTAVPAVVLGAAALGVVFGTAEPVVVLGTAVLVVFPF